MSNKENKPPKRINEGKKFHPDYEFISNDPQENADNFDPKWSYLREMTTDEERYQAIRKRWGNSDIPDPSKNLTFIQPKINEVENLKPEPKVEVKQAVRSTARSATRKRNRRQSRSCTRPFEKLISDLEKNYVAEYQRLMSRHEFEWQEMMQVQLIQKLSGFYPHFQQKQDAYQLLSNQYQQVQSFIGEKNENVEACKRYMEEVKAFFLFYQKINDEDILLQMTDDQYEHTNETEKMYALYSKFYK